MFATIDDVELFYETSGTGPRMILLHGGLGLDHTAFRPALDPLSERLEMVFLDLRGCGRSSRPPYDGVDHARYAADIEGLRRHLGGEKIILFGHSYGAFIAQDYALAYPDALDALILCSAAPRIDYPDVIMGNAARKGTPEQVAAIGRALSQPYQSDEAFAEAFNLYLPVYFHQFDPERHRSATENCRFAAEAFNHTTSRCLPTFDVLERLSSIRVPTLVLAGADDWVAPPVQGAERIHARIAGSEMVVFEKSGHYAFLEENAAFLDVVRDWLRRHELV